ncbi:protein S100-A1-like [Scyliorhinus canicula]|uniref:protein S100-A1-like n=1 Tax=Scyliorhinus canicula TaxID=7830 RepID=UPI0018F7581D|nr:protein S100-A1-like [Scyliorhinus canicula]
MGWARYNKPSNLQNCSTSGQKLEQEQPPAMATPTKTELAMQNLMDVFYQYVEGDKYTLTRCQMKSLVDAELGQLTKNNKNIESFDKMMKDLDFDGDGEMNFEEFVSFIASLMFSCNTIYLQKREQQAKK